MLVFIHSDWMVKKFKETESLKTINVKINLKIS